MNSKPTRYLMDPCERTAWTLRPHDQGSVREREDACYGVDERLSLLLELSVLFVVYLPLLTPRTSEAGADDDKMSW